MVRPLRKRERETHRAEHPGTAGMRLSIALDAENQVDPGLRERVVKARTYGAQMIAAQRVIAQ